VPDQPNSGVRSPRVVIADPDGEVVVDTSKQANSNDVGDTRSDGTHDDAAADPVARATDAASA
jgi:hypothetical protein